jgi:hypothetical protein
MKREGFLQLPLEDLVTFVDTPSEALNAITHYSRGEDAVVVRGG